MSPLPLYNYLSEKCPFFTFKYKEPFIDAVYFKMEVYVPSDSYFCFAILCYNTDGSYYDLIVSDQDDSANYIDLEDVRKIVKLLETVEEFKLNYKNMCCQTIVQPS